MSKKTLIYIIGAGRSGTTLLDIVLGNNSNTISLGEVNRFFKRNGLPPKRKHNSNEFLFWSKISEDIKQLLNDVSFKYFDKLFKKNEYHTTVLKSILNNNDKEYIQTLNLHYSLIHENVQEETLIESSKYPVRALNLSKHLSTEDFDIKFIYLKKDPVDVVSSFGKRDIEQPRKGFFSANLYYLMVNLLCSFAIKRLKKRGNETISIKYEDLINNPEQTINKISNKLNVDLSSLISKLSTKKALNTGFLFDGNRIRLKESLTLRVLDNKHSKTIRYYFTKAFNFIVYRA